MFLLSYWKNKDNLLLCPVISQYNNCRPTSWYQSCSPSLSSLSIYLYPPAPSLSIYLPAWLYQPISIQPTYFHSSYIYLPNSKILFLAHLYINVIALDLVDVDLLFSTNGLHWYNLIDWGKVEPIQKLAIHWNMVSNNKITRIGHHIELE